jgi:Mn-dependent DtxR family transcriptional regulator
MKKNSLADKIYVIQNTLTDEMLIPETKLVVIYGILGNIDGKIELEQFSKELFISKYKLKKVEKQLKELGIIKIKDL